jgi:hypothetical protein
MKKITERTLAAILPFEYWLNKFPIGMRADLIQARTTATEFESLKDFILFGFVWSKTKQGTKYWSELVK